MRPRSTGHAAAQGAQRGRVAVASSRVAAPIAAPIATAVVAARVWGVCGREHGCGSDVGRSAHSIGQVAKPGVAPESQGARGHA